MGNDDSLAILREQIPSAIIDPQKRSAEESTPVNTCEQQKRKLIKENMKDARQFVRWDRDSSIYNVFWTTKKILIADHGEPEAMRIWKTECFR